MRGDSVDREHRAMPWYGYDRHKAGFSSALGAFVMGSILAETIDAERIEHLVKP